MECQVRHIGAEYAIAIVKGNPRIRPDLSPPVITSLSSALDSNIVPSLCGWADVYAILYDVAKALVEFECF